MKITVIGKGKLLAVLILNFNNRLKISRHTVTDKGQQTPCLEIKIKDFSFFRLKEKFIRLARHDLTVDHAGIGK